MKKSIIALLALTLTAFGLEQKQFRGSLRLKEEKVTLEYSATEDQAVMIVEAESEDSLDQVQVSSPLGASILRLQAENGHELGFSGFRVETRELDASSLFATYAEGSYELHARTEDGREAIGSAVLSHDLPRPPVVLYPRDGAVDVPTDPTLKWAASAAASRYRVSLEQGESDGMAVDLPGSAHSLRVPPGVLAPKTETHVEIGAVGPNGNCTLVEFTFTTR